MERWRRTWLTISLLVPLAKKASPSCEKISCDQVEPFPPVGVFDSEWILDSEPRTKNSCFATSYPGPRLYALLFWGKELLSRLWRGGGYNCSKLIPQHRLYLSSCADHNLFLSLSSCSRINIHCYWIISSPIAMFLVSRVSQAVPPLFHGLSQPG